MPVERQIGHLGLAAVWWPLVVGWPSPGGAHSDTPAAATPASSDALRLVTDDRTESTLHEAFAQRDAQLVEALERSLAWLDGPDSVAHFPSPTLALDRAHARAGVEEFRRLLEQSADPARFAAEVHRRFDVYAATGVEGGGAMLVTGYFAPEYEASRTERGRFRHPLYEPPAAIAGLMPDPPPWHPRDEIERGGLLAGRELAWLADPLDVYLVHVNGAARLNFEDGTAMCVAHVGTNGRPYTSLGRLMIEEGLAAERDMSMQTIRDVHARAPERVQALMRRNERFVFFREHECDAWPVSGLGIVLTSHASVATDRALFPAGGVVLVETTLTDASGAERSFRRFMLDQDRGGAIKGAGRVDLFLGVGPAAGEIAGRQRHPGRLYYLILKSSTPALPSQR